MNAAQDFKGCTYYTDLCFKSQSALPRQCRVLHFWNHAILGNPNRVMTVILETLAKG
jgi:hypothetical protein